MSDIQVRAYAPSDLPEMIAIWNRVVEDGVAFPQEEPLDAASGAAFFAAQSLSAVAVNDGGAILGLYILHPNNVGRCGHICNASYAVRSDARGRHIGEALVKDCLVQAKALGFPTLELTINGKPIPATAFRFSLRIPGWCRKFTLSLNGKRVAAKADKGVVALKRIWRPGDEIVLDLAMPVQVLRANDSVAANFEQIFETFSRDTV